MLHKTRGIVLHYLKYRETSVIARVYTEEFGIQSYIINSVRSQKSKKGLALLQPLTVLDMVVYHKAANPDGLHRLSEYKPAYSFRSIPFEVKKSTIALFCTEFLTKVLREEEHHGAVFDFLFHFIKTLDERNEKYEYLHLNLMIQLTHYLGFGIHDLKELESHTIIGQTQSNYEKIYQGILSINDQNLEKDISIDNDLRKDILAYMIGYYVLHIEDFKGMKSVEVLSQIFQ